MIQVPSQKIIEVVKLEKGCQGLVTSGINAGQIGKIESVEEGTFILPKRVVLCIGRKKNRNSNRHHHGSRKRGANNSIKVIICLKQQNPQ